MLGTLAVHELPAIPSVGAVVPMLLIALLALRTTAARPVVWFCAAALWTAFCAQQRLDERLPLEARGRDVAVGGWIDGFPTSAPGQTAFAFRVEPRVAGVPERLRITWYGAPELAAGDSLALTVRLRPPHGARNPSGFDYEQWLLVNGFGATGYVRSGEHAPPSAQWGARWQRYRAKLAQRLASSAPSDDAAALLIALAIGERYRFDERHWTDFRRTGTSHLVAVSGMHVALLGLAVFAVLRWSCLRLPAPWRSFDLEWAAAGSALATAYYAALTGFAVPAQRSLVMIVVALAVLVSRRSIGAVQGLAATLVAVLVWDPFAPLTASFWLSFVAVAVLLALAMPRPLGVGGTLQRTWYAARTFVALQWAIALALVPLTAWYFGELSLVGPVVNLIAIPVFNFALVPLAVLATAAVSLAPLAAATELVVHVAGVAAGAAVAVLHACADLQWAALGMPLPPRPAMVIAVCGVVFALAAPPLRGRALAWLAIVPLFVPRVSLPAHGEVRAVVLDVGHGLAVLVETRRHRLLFDAGPTFPSGFDTGADIVLPALAANGRRGLDVLVVSHADNDHAGGAAAVAAAFPDAVVLTGPDAARFGGGVCAAGQQWQWDGVLFRVLHPAPTFAARGNESSCVLKIEAAGAALLLTGDIERLGETALAAAPLRADVVVVPHHGSATSSTPAFVTATRAAHAVVSAGWANRWGFPRAEVRKRWRDAGAALLVTGESGAISIALGREGAVVRAERDGRHRYWQTPPDGAVGAQISMVNQNSARYSSAQF